MVLVNVSLNERMRMPFYDGDTYTRIKIAKLIYTYVSADRSELDDFFCSPSASTSNAKESNQQNPSIKPSLFNYYIGCICMLIHCENQTVHSSSFQKISFLNKKIRERDFGN